MMIYNQIQNLYQPNSQYADNLLSPQRWCHRQWEDLTTFQNTDYRNKILKTVKLIIFFAPLSLITIASYFTGCIGIACKAYEDPYPKLRFEKPTTLSIDEVIKLKIHIRDLYSDISEYNDSVFEVTPQNQGFFTVTRKRKASFIQKTIVKDIPKMTLSTKRELSVSELPPNPETLLKIGKVAREWQSTAWKKIDYREKTNEVFNDLQTISKLIAQCMEHPSRTRDIWDRIFVCEDVALKEIQAIALTKDHPFHIEIKHIATHPHNVRSGVNQTELTRVEGAGSAIIYHLINTPDIDQQIIYLESVRSAKLFYQKFGFKETGEIPTEFGTIPMTLSRNKTLSLRKESA